MSVREEQIKEIAKLLSKEKRVVFLTGAGISVPSGIPDFRSPQGIWTKYDMNEYGTLSAFMKNPEKLWTFFWDIYEMGATAKPNSGHKALAEIEKIREKIGKHTVIITQNIDLLHTKAGNKYVIELHGNPEKLVCLKCGENYELNEFKIEREKKLPPRCKKCGEILKMDIILFGEQLKTDTIKNAFYEAQMADLIIAVGTSLAVSPANSLFFYGKKRGIINLEMPIIPVFEADFILLGDASKILPQIVYKLKDIVYNEKPDLERNDK